MTIYWPQETQERALAKAVVDSSRELVEYLEALLPDVLPELRARVRDDINACDEGAK